MDKVGRIYREAMVNSIKEGIDSNNSVFLVGYTAISAAQMDDLRKGLSRLGGKVSVARNRIAKIALKEVECGNLPESIEGQTAFAWSNEDSVEISKLLVKFSKDCKGFSVLGGLLDGAVLNKEDVQRLSDLPSKDVLRAQLLGTIIAPLTRLAGALNAKSRDLLSILKQYGESKEGGN